MNRREWKTTEGSLARNTIVRTTVRPRAFHARTLPGRVHVHEDRGLDGRCSTATAATWTLLRGGRGAAARGRETDPRGSPTGAAGGTWLLRLESNQITQFSVTTVTFQQPNVIRGYRIREADREHFIIMQRSTGKQRAPWGPPEQRGTSCMSDKGTGISSGHTRACDHTGKGLEGKHWGIKKNSTAILGLNWPHCQSTASRLPVHPPTPAPLQRAEPSRTCQGARG